MQPSHPECHLPPEPAMNLKTLDSLLQRALHLGLAFVVTAGMLGGIDTLARTTPAASQVQPQDLAATAAAPRA
jgi:hypothetical protein